MPPIGMEIGDWSRQARVLVRRSPLPPSMRAMLVEICLEIEQLAFQIRRGPKQHAIQILASNRADQPLHKRMGEGNIGNGFDLGHLQYPQIGLPLPKPKKGITVGAEILGHPSLPSNGAVEHPAECDTVDGSGMDAKPNNSAGILIHDNQNPVGSQRSRFPQAQIQTPEAIFHVANESQPGRATGVLSWPIVTGENPANNVFVDGDVESQGNLLSNPRTAPGWIALLHLNDGFDEFFAGPFWSGLTPVLGGEEQAILSVPQSPVEAQESRRFQHDCRTDQAGGANEESTQTGDEAIGKAQIG